MQNASVQLIRRGTPLSATDGASAATSPATAIHSPLIAGRGGPDNEKRCRPGSLGDHRFGEPVRIFGATPFAFRKIGVLQGNFFGLSQGLLNV